MSAYLVCFDFNSVRSVRRVISSARPEMSMFSFSNLSQLVILVKLLQLCAAL